MTFRFGLLAIPVMVLALPLSICAAGGDTQPADFTKPVQTPDGVLQPGHYTISLEDQLPDRAIVRITEPGGTDHLLLAVPSKKLASTGKGVVLFPNNSGTQALEAWKCASCKAALEFVYPKDDAVKLTAETGKPIMAYDSSYDKLPANLSAEDRKVVTLWLLSPKTVTPDGKGEGVNAAKLSLTKPSPTLTASAESGSHKLPKTAGNAFFEIALGTLSLFLAGALFVGRKLSLGRHS